MQQTAYTMRSSQMWSESNIVTKKYLYIMHHRDGSNAARESNSSPCYHDVPPSLITFALSFWYASLTPRRETTQCTFPMLLLPKHVHSRH